MADHGFATHGGRFDVAATLKAKGWLERVHPVVIGGDVYVPKEHQQHLGAMVRALQEDPSIGPIFTPPKSRGSAKGVVPGTLSHELAGGGHPRGPQIRAYPKWTDARNAAGYSGDDELRVNWVRPGRSMRMQSAKEDESPIDPMSG